MLWSIKLEVVGVSPIPRSVNLYLLLAMDQQILRL